MANTFNNLIPDLYEAIDVVSRELSGFIPAVTLDASGERAALNEAIRVPITGAQASENATPGQLPPDTGDQNIGNNPFSITKSKAVPFRWTGDDQKGVNNGPGYHAIRLNQISQSIRTLVNEIEADVAATAVSASRASGVVSADPFATDLSDTANVRKILSDNGAPVSDMQMVINTTAGANMRKLLQLTKANEAGDTKLLRQGILESIHGFDVRESAGVLSHVAGAITGTVTGSAAKGATSVTLTTAAGASVALVAGDIVTFAGDPNQYVVAAAATIGASTTGTVTLSAPGLLTTISNAAITAIASGAYNLGFARSAIVLATRKIAIPEEGDMAEDSVEIVDPRTGLVFEFAMYKQYLRVRYEVRLAWGTANIKPEHSAILLGKP